jgi:signal transduction histidine kinase
MWMTGALMVVGVYRLRVRQMSHSMTARFDERLSERTRVAREIHDTLLQTLQGSKLVADLALKDPADHTRMVGAMEQLSTWLAQATAEGRAALKSLRASATETNDLAEALRRAVDESRDMTRAEVSLTTKGDAREMHPVVRDEIYRIAYEAIRNACQHSRAERIEVSLEYGHDLVLSVRDNGIGVGPDIAAKGKEGHFGVAGMKERAMRIGGSVTLVGDAGAGTVMTLVVAGRLAFRRARSTEKGG